MKVGIGPNMRPLVTRMHPSPPGNRAPFPRRYLLYYSEENFLQKLTAILPRGPSPEDAKRYWIIYIHGGAWRDPNIKYDSFYPTYYRLRKSPVAEHIAGYVSVSYNLSPHPDHPERHNLDKYWRRQAKHPDHIHDVIKSLRFLQRKFSFGDNYILVGHSCGATLVFQAVMKDTLLGTDDKIWEGVKMPQAVIGVEGIYDIPALLDAHKDIPVYQEFIEGAFGPVEDNWRLASPTAGDFLRTWTDGVLAILAHSDEDELVEENQVKLMSDVLLPWSGDGTTDGKKRSLLVNTGLKGKHDEIWQKGEGMFVCIEKALTVLVDRWKTVGSTKESRM